MAEQEITLKKQRMPFTQVPNELLCNNLISGIAKAMWCVFYSKPDGWTFYWPEIVRNFREGREALFRAKKELEKAGYLKTIQKRIPTGRGKETKYGGMDLEIFHTPNLTLSLEPSSSSQTTGFQQSGSQNSGRQVAENPYTNKDLKKKDLSKKDLLSLSEVENFADEILRERNFSIDVKKFFDWATEENLKASWKNVLKSWIENPRNQIKKALAPESKEIKNIRERIKTALIMNQDDYYLYFDGAIEKTDSGFVIKVEDKRALKYEKALDKKNVKIEVKNA